MRCSLAKRSKVTRLSLSRTGRNQGSADIRRTVGRTKLQCIHQLFHFLYLLAFHSPARMSENRMTPAVMDHFLNPSNVGDVMRISMTVHGSTNSELRTIAARPLSLERVPSMPAPAVQTDIPIQPVQDQRAPSRRPVQVLQAGPPPHSPIARQRSLRRP